MKEEERQKIISGAKDFFRTRIAENHLADTENMTSLSKFDVNPFTLRYLAHFAFGDSSPENMAKALIYPYVLDTSIPTTFGTQPQFFCSEVLSAYASSISGIDIEFIDPIDGRRKYCQIMIDPTTFSLEDAVTVRDHFRDIPTLARVSHPDIRPTDCIVGFFYGNPESLSSSCKKIEEEYPVYVGKEFWQRLTGDEDFYSELIDAFAEVAADMDSSRIMRELIESLAKDIERAEL